MKWFKKSFKFSSGVSFKNFSGESSRNVFPGLLHKIFYLFSQYFHHCFLRRILQRFLSSNLLEIYLGFLHKFWDTKFFQEEILHEFFRKFVHGFFFEISQGAPLLSHPTKFTSENLPEIFFKNFLRHSSEDYSRNFSKMFFKKYSMWFLSI